MPRPALASAIRACQTDKPTPADVSRLRDELLTLPAESWGVPLASAEAVRSLAGLVLGSDVPSAATAVVEANAARLASDLAGPEAGPMVRAAAAQAAAAGLCLDAVTARYGRAVAGSYSLDNAAAFERRMTAAQTRYLRALATVAALRRAEGSERERAAKMERDAPAAPPPELARTPDRSRVRCLWRLDPRPRRPRPGDGLASRPRWRPLSRRPTGNRPSTPVRRPRAAGGLSERRAVPVRFRSRRVRRHPARCPVAQLQHVKKGTAPRPVLHPSDLYLDGARKPPKKYC